MLNRGLIILAVLVCATSTASAQQRVKKSGPEDFSAIYKTLGEAWETESYGEAADATRALATLINVKRTEAILAAMPAAPAGYSVVAKRKNRNQANHPFAGMAAAIGHVINQKYKPSEGRGNLEVNVTAGSPLAQMFKAWIVNPAALGPDAELVKYNQYDAVLKKQRNGWQLQILIDKDVIEVKAPGKDDEFLLGWINQDAVDVLAAALSK